MLVYSETEDPLATSALFIAAEFLPAFAAPALTARLDQLPLRRVLPRSTSARRCASASWRCSRPRSRCPLVLALALIDGILMLTARGLSRGAVNAVLQPAGELRAGTAC